MDAALHGKIAARGQEQGLQQYLNMLQKEEEAATFDSIPQLAHLGQPFQSTKPERLTEEETEYSVTLVKHVFESNILLQFTCTNTVAEQVLEKVSVSLELEDTVSTLQIPFHLGKDNAAGMLADIILK